MIRKGHGRIAALFLATVMTAGFAADGSKGIVLAAEGEQESGASVAESFSIERLTSNYTKVSAGYTASDYRGEAKVFPMEEAVAASDKGLLTDDNYGYDGKTADIRHGMSLKMAVEVPETALYWIGFDYLSYDESILPIEFSLKVDGDYPFYEARNLNFETNWVQDGSMSKDRYGNEIVSMPD